MANIIDSQSAAREASADLPRGVVTMSRMFPGVAANIAAMGLLLAALSLPVVLAEKLVGKFDIQLANAPNTPRTEGGPGQPGPTLAVSMTMARRMINETLSDSSGEGVTIDPEPQNYSGSHPHSGRREELPTGEDEEGHDAYPPEHGIILRDDSDVIATITGEPQKR